MLDQDGMHYEEHRGENRQRHVSHQPKGHPARHYLSGTMWADVAGIAERMASARRYVKYLALN
ncbi:MAG: hypothetical protein ACYDH5_14510 [Acidimicrobiales bacterium]